MGAGSVEAVLGEVVADRYRVVEVLGDGGMGVVYRGEDIRLTDRAVAIKVLVPSGEVDSDAASRFDREARIMSRLNHPNLVAIHDTGHLADERPFIVMELLEGETLAERAARAPIDLDELEELAEQIGRGLDAAHRSGVVHRDLKPHNIFLCGNPGEPAAVKLLDFGISKLVGSMTMRTETTQIVGTPQYMSPEQARGEHELISPRSDVFAFATIVYELVSGARPFDGQMLHEVVFKIIDYHPPLLTEVADVPDRVAAAVAVAMAKNPRDRFASAGAFVRALTGDEPVELPAVDDEPDGLPTVRERPARPDERDAPPRPRRLRWLWIPVAVLVLAIAGLALRDRAINGHPHQIGARLATLDAAFAAGDRGRTSMTLGRDREALIALVQAYRGGDPRMATRVALRRALTGAEALIASFEFDTELDDVDLHPDGDELLVRERGVVRRLDFEGREVDAPVAGGLLAGRYSLDGRRILYADADHLWIINRADRREVHRIAGAAVASHLENDKFLVARPVRNSLEFTYSRWTVGRDAPDWQIGCDASAAGLIAREIGNHRGVFCGSSPKLVDLETGELIARLGDAAGRVAILPGGDRILMFDDSGAGTLINDRGESTPLPLEPRPISTLSLSDDGRLLAIGGGSAVVEIRDASDPRLPLIRQLSARGSVEVVRFTPDSQTLAIGDSSGSVSVFDAGTGHLLLSATGHSSPVTGLLVSGDGGRLLSYSGRQLRVWDLVSSRDRVLYRGRAGNVDLDATGEVVAIDAPGGLQIISGSERKILPIEPQVFGLSRSGEWLIADGVAFNVESGRSSPLLEDAATIQLSDDATLIALDNRREHWVFGRRGDQFIRVGPISEKAIASIAADGSAFAVTSRESIEIRAADNELLVKRDVDRPELIATLSNDGEVAITMIPGATLLWWWRTDRRLSFPSAGFPFIRHGDELLARLPDGFLAVSLESGKAIEITLPCPVRTGAAAGELLLLRCRDGRARLWDLAAGVEILRFDKRTLGFTPTNVRMGHRGGRAIARSGDVIISIDVSAEDRPAAEVEAIATRLLGNAPPPL